MAHTKAQAAANNQGRGSGQVSQVSNDLLLVLLRSFSKGHKLTIRSTMALLKIHDSWKIIFAAVLNSVNISMLLHP